MMTQRDTKPPHLGSRIAESVRIAGRKGNRGVRVQIHQFGASVVFAAIRRTRTTGWSLSPGLAGLVRVRRAVAVWPAPLQVGQRWHVERTNAWHNAFNRLQ